jgi:hypothetical protein
VRRARRRWSVPRFWPNRWSWRYLWTTPTAEEKTVWSCCVFVVDKCRNGMATFFCLFPFRVFAQFSAPQARRPIVLVPCSSSSNKPSPFGSRESRTVGYLCVGPWREDRLLWSQTSGMSVDSCFFQRQSDGEMSEELVRNRMCTYIKCSQPSFAVPRKPGVHDGSRVPTK